MNAEQPKPADIDAYLAGLPEDSRIALEQLRCTIRALVPDVVEAISYGMPAFKYRGRWLVWIGAAKKHCALYGLSAAAESHRDELAAFDVSKGTIRFAPASPLPDAVVRSLLRSRMDAIEAAAAAPKPSRRRPSA